MMFIKIPDNLSTLHSSQFVAADYIVTYHYLILKTNSLENKTTIEKLVMAWGK